VSRSFNTNVKKGHLPHLDALRAFAIILVVWRHFPTGSEHFARFGALGVNLFFALSGFLITRILIKHRGRIGLWKTFAVRRGLRILPAYWFTLIIAVAIGGSEILRELPFHLSYTSNFYIAWKGEWIGSTSPMWSLSVEEQFYLLWPPLVIFCPPKHLKNALVLLMGVMSIGYAIIGGLGGYLILGAPISLVAGSWVACRENERLDVYIPFLAIFTAWVILSILGPEQSSLDLHPIMAIPLGMTCAGIVHWTASGLPRPLSWIAEARPIVAIGEWSYGIYLTHLTVIPGFLPPGMRTFPIVLIVSIALSAIMYKYIEMPVLALKKHWPYSRTYSRGYVPQHTI
jgi:peptidoglycan/LPS O-acetylase OafA/YrhL